MEDTVRRFNEEEVRLQETVQQIVNVAANVNASRSTATAGQVAAQRALATGSQSAAEHTAFESSSQSNQAEIARLDADLQVLEQDLSNSSRSVQ